MTNNEEKHFPKRWIACPIEEEYLNNRKMSRIERKRLSAKDRSKFKKTNHQKYEENLKQDLQRKNEEKISFQGRVLSITSQGVIVDLSGEKYVCTLRGLLKKEKRRLKNLVTIGDFVHFEKTLDNEGFIIDVEPRTSTLSRADNLSRRKEQLLAANIDLVLITSSVISPSLKPQLIDRYIIAARKGNMHPVILINKIDLLENPTHDGKIRESQRRLLEQCKEAYQKVNIPLIALSVKDEKGLDQLQEVMKGKASVFSGQSGTGKSSLINSVTGLQLPVGETVKKTRKGAHTTTQAHLIPLDFGGWCIDTPGIKSFGVWNLQPDELQQYYMEFHAKNQQCKFPNCSHIHEEKCAVIKAVEEGNIPKLRYTSYIALMEASQKKHQRR